MAYGMACPASLSGLEEAVMEGQDACKGLARSSSIFRHTLGELDAALDSLKLRDAWAGNRPSNGVSTCSILGRHPHVVADIIDRGEPGLRLHPLQTLLDTSSTRTSSSSTAGR